MPVDGAGSTARPGDPDGSALPEAAPPAPVSPAGTPSSGAGPGRPGLTTVPPASEGELAAPELSRFAGELAAQLFQRWQVALQQQFHEELRFRLNAELAHRQHEAGDLRQEVDERRARQSSSWNRRHGPFGHASFEMEQTIRRQSSQLDEMERQMHEIRARLREMGRSTGGSVATVDTEPFAGATEPETVADVEAELSDPGGAPAPAEGGPAPEEVAPEVEDDPHAPPAQTLLSLTSTDVQELAAGLAARLFEPWELTLREQFREELGQRLEDELVLRERQTSELREEVEERRAIWEGMWSVQHRRGATTDTDRWELEQRIRRQASELEETERAMREIRERLRDLGADPDRAGMVVDAGPGQS